MAWIRVDDHFDEHPKLAAVGPLGVALWIAGLAYCNRNQTDGFIPWSRARSLLSWEFIGPGLAGAQADAQARAQAKQQQVVYQICITNGMSGDDVDGSFVVDLLVGVGLWVEVEGGYAVHDYSDYQPTREQIEAAQAKKQAAGRAGGQASAQARAQAPATASAQAPAQPRAQAKRKQNPTPNPSPIVNPSGEQQPPLPPKKPSRNGEVINAIRARGLDPNDTDRDHAAIKGSRASPEDIAEVYTAVYSGTYGDDFMRRQLSIHAAIGWVDGYKAYCANPTTARPRNGRPPEQPRKLLDVTHMEIPD